MLSFFPQYYDDELLYSILARYHQMSANTSFQHTAKELFGSRSVCAIVDLPLNLNYLCAQVPGIEADEMIDNHTLLPYYSPFLSEERIVLLRHAMKVPTGASIHALLGTRNVAVKLPKRLRYCPKCADNQKTNYGVCYWRRVHQLAYVLVCPDHQVLLKESKFAFSNKNNHRPYHFLQPSFSDEDVDVSSFSDHDLEHVLFIAEQSAWLLSSPLIVNREKQIRQFYFNKLIPMDGLTPSNRVRVNHLICQFNAYYGRHFLSFMGSFVDTDSSVGSWLHNVVRDTSVSCHPLRHILLTRFFDSNLKELLTAAIKVAPGPFGCGPWPCLNQASVHYRKHIIPTCKLTRNKRTGEKIGTFVCECGYVYTRSERNADKQFQYKGRVKTVGEVWLREFQRLRNEGKSLRSMVRMLGVSDTVIRRYLEARY